MWLEPGAAGGRVSTEAVDMLPRWYLKVEMKAAA
jgi:hypothetical protein